MTHYEHLIDPTTIEAIRRHLNSPASPIREVLFVAELQLLPTVAMALDATSGLSSHQRIKQWKLWLEGGAVVPNRSGGYGIDLDALPGESRCRVIFLPPVYVVHVPGLDLQHQVRNAA
ncbi:MAG: hypothetical protein JNN07_27000 [Verrucomicrobiales bacterium]|nr:hypothetical protein [Verrucomicrobiales bacterium]